MRASDQCPPPLLSLLVGMQGILPIQRHRNLTECVCVCDEERGAEHAWDSSVEWVWHNGQSMCWQCSEQWSGSGLAMFMHGTLQSMWSEQWSGTHPTQPTTQTPPTHPTPTHPTHPKHFGASINPTQIQPPTKHSHHPIPAHSPQLTYPAHSHTQHIQPRQNFQNPRKLILAYFDKFLICLTYRFVNQFK